MKYYYVENVRKVLLRKVFEFIIDLDEEECVYEEMSVLLKMLVVKFILCNILIFRV